MDLGGGSGDDDAMTVRDRAMFRLAQQGASAVPVLVQATQPPSSPETRRNAILDSLPEILVEPVVRAALLEDLGGGDHAAAGLARRQAAHGAIFIEGTRQAVDPAEAKCLEHQFLVTWPSHCRTDFGVDHPYSSLFGVVGAEPAPPSRPTAGSERSAHPQILSRGHRNLAFGTRGSVWHNPARAQRPLYPLGSQLPVEPTCPHGSSPPSITRKSGVPLSCPSRSNSSDWARFATRNTALSLPMHAPLVTDVQSKKSAFTTQSSNRH